MIRGKWRGYHWSRHPDTYASAQLFLRRYLLRMRDMWLYELWSVVSGEATVEADIWIHLHHQRHVFVASLLKKIMLSFKFNLYKVIPWIQLGKNGVSPCPGQRWVIEYAPLRAVPDNAELQSMLRSALSRTSPSYGVCSAPHCPGQHRVMEYAPLRTVPDNAELWSMLRSALSRITLSYRVCYAPRCPGQRWVIAYAPLRAVQDNTNMFT